jgi:hypothetical protein
MPTLSQILTDELSGAVKAIQQNMDSNDYSASGGTKRSLLFEVTQGEASIKGVISGDKSLKWAETGRPPRESSTSSGLADKILEWMPYRGIGNDLSEKGKASLANFITLKINRLGTKLWRDKGSKGQTRDIYTSVLDKTAESIEDAIKDLMTETIQTSFTKAFEPA